MGRIAKPAANKFGIYKHFAAATIVITLAVALFADETEKTRVGGEAKRTAEAVNVTQRVAKADEPGGGQVLYDSDAGDSGSGGGDFSFDIAAFDSGNGGYLPDGLSFEDGDFFRSPVPGISAEQWARMSDEQREAALRAAPTAAELARASAASAARSGSAGTNGDGP